MYYCYKITLSNGQVVRITLIDRLVVEITLTELSMRKITFIKGLVVKSPFIDGLVVKLNCFIWYILRLPSLIGCWITHIDRLAVRMTY